MSNKSRNAGVNTGLKSSRSNSSTDVTAKQDDLSVMSSPEKKKGYIPTVRYITEDLIKRLSREDHLEIITSLNLNLGKESGRFKYIENLEPLKRLQVLNLSGNSFEKIEKLDRLTNLTELNLSDNCLTKIENLESLIGLQVLHLAGNQIQHIPMWLTKKLKALQVFGIGRNQIQSIDEICKLHSLNNLVHLSVAGNPFSKIPHYRLLIVFRLRTLQMLDNEEVSLQERSEAKERFEQEELERLSNQLEILESEKTQLVSENNQYSKNEQELDNHLRLLEEEKQSFAQQLQEKEQELEMAVQLLQKKTNELIRTNKKQFGLEQELAFYKIDHKFDTLSQPYIDTTEYMSEEESSVAESPYIGKAMYRANRIAKEEFINAVPLQLQVRQSDGWVKDVGHISSLSTTDTNSAEQFSQVLETEKGRELSMELEKKQNLIREAELCLKQLQSEIEKHERYLITKPQRENSLIPSASQSEENPKHTIESNQASKINQSALKNETKPKRKQIDVVDSNYENLKDKLIQKFTSMKQELERIGSLKLADGHMLHNEESGEELESIIHSIESHIRGIRQTADVQSVEMKELLKNNSELTRESNRLMQECEQIQRKSDTENVHLKQELADYKKSLLELRSINESLQKQLRTNQMHAPLEFFEKIKMENEELNKAVAALEAQMQEERVHFDKKQHANKRQMNDMKKEIFIGKQMDNDNQILCRQLGELQKANIHLQDQLYAAQQQLQHQKQKMVSPEALRKRLEEVARMIGTPKEGVKSVRENGNDAAEDCHLQSNTLVEEAIGDLEEEICQKLEAKSADLEKAQQAKNRLASKLQQMQDEITRVRMQERSKAEQVMEATARKARIEKDNLLAEISRLEEAMLQRDLEQKGQPLKPGGAEFSNTAAASKSIAESTTATTRSSTESGTYTSSSTTTSSPSSSASSLWSVRKRDLYNAMNTEEKALFDELQRQIEELRSLLAAKDKKSVSMVHTAQQTFNKLNDMIDQRYMNDGTLAESYDASTGYSSTGTSMASESEYYDDPQLKETVEELRKAHSEMESLKDRLIVRDHKRSPPHALHEDERSLIYAILDEQQAEIDRLSHAIAKDARNKGPAVLGHSGATVPATVDIRQPLQQAAHYGQEYTGADILSESNSLQEKSRLWEPNFLKDDKTKTREFVSEYEKGRSPYRGGFQHDGAAFLHQPSRPMHYQPQQSFPRYPSNAIAANNQNLAVDSNLPPNLTYRLPGLASYNGNHIESLGTMEVPVMKQTIPAQGVAYPTGPAVPMPVGAIADSGLNQNFRFPNAVKDQPLVNPLFTQTNNSAGLPQTDDQNAGRNDTCNLFCNISQHHDLEDYVSELLQKIRHLNGQLNKTNAEVIRNGTSHVPLKDAPKMTQSWVHELISELKKRRIELEGLDLAIEREKFNLEEMKLFEVSLLSRHKTISRELEALNQSKKDRSYYLPTIGPLYDPENSEFNFDTTYYWSKKHYIIDELICTEETLMERKRQLAETEQDLTELNKTLINTQSELNSVEIEFLASVESLREMEQSAHDKNILLLDMEFKINETQEELENLQQSKKQSEKMLDDMENVIRAKDEEFQILRLQIEQAAKRLFFID